ncbi:hypothetical protein ACFLTE_09770 [Bacteroidota bacterium]
MKRIGKIAIIAMLVFSFSILYAQDKNLDNLSKYELKILKLEEKVTKAELNVAKYEEKLKEADSLMQQGKQNQVDARIQIAFLVSQENKYIRRQNKEIKELNKRKKRADKEELDEIKLELKALDNEYKTWIKEHDKSFKSATKNFDKGYSLQEKGRLKVKQYKPILKDARKGLEQAIDNLEDYRSEYELADN